MSPHKHSPESTNFLIFLIFFLSPKTKTGLGQAILLVGVARGRSTGTQFTFFTSTKVQILTPEELQGIIFLLNTPSIKGPINVCAPEPVTNAGMLTHPDVC